MRSVGEREQRHLLTVEQFLEHELAAERSDRAQCVIDLFGRPTDEHALAGRQTVRLDDARSARNRQRLGSRHTRRAQNILRERLRSFDLGGRRAGAEHRDPVPAQDVGDPGHQRSFWADHHQVCFERQCQAEKAVSIVGPNWMAAPECGDAGVARGGVELGQARALLEAPREGVLASTGADDHHLHAARILAS